MKLRPYQIEALQAIHARFQAHPIALLQAATGAGKTVVACRLVNKYYQQYPHHKFLFLMHKKELVHQFVETLLQHTDIPEKDISVCCAGISKRTDLDARVLVATVQTLVNKMGKYLGADTVVCDETHRVGLDSESQYQQVLTGLRERKPKHRTLGITATAYRLNHGYIYGDRCKKSRTNFYPSLTHRITYKRLCKEGFLVPLKGVVAASPVILALMMDVQKSGGDFVMSDAGSKLAPHVETCVDAYEHHAQGRFKKVAIFACTIEHAEQLAEAFNKRGSANGRYKANVVHSKLNKKNRDKNLHDWRYGDVEVNCSVNILNEGFDFPELACLIMARPTLSPVIWIQSVGRIVRIAKGKKEAFLIDMVGNIREFGLDLDNPNFKIPKGMDGEGECPTKVCPGELDIDQACGAVVHASVRICPDCGHVFAEDTIPPDMRPEEMEDFEVVQLEPPAWHDVVEMEYSTHESKSDKKLGKVVLELDSLSSNYYGQNEKASVWICYGDYYSGYAVEMGEEKWEQFSAEPFPDSVEEAEFVAEFSFTKPKRVFCQRNEDGYLNVEELDFAESDVEQHNSPEPHDLPELPDMGDDDEVPF